MPKKSHRVASRQAEVSKERKRKKRSQASQKRAVAISASPSPAPKPPAQPSASKPSLPQAVPRYRYFIADLRKIGVIAGAMLIILIVLAFLLG
ncbi:MAG: hypothetical protein IBX36_02835 [Dehalococcoidia bacterium]|nr:hypothetical protein [Dehalococcoidia bacterium]